MPRRKPHQSIDTFSSTTGLYAVCFVLAAIVLSLMPGMYEALAGEQTDPTMASLVESVDENEIPLSQGGPPGTVSSTHDPATRPTAADPDVSTTTTDASTSTTVNSPVPQGSDTTTTSQPTDATLSSAPATTTTTSSSTSSSVPPATTTTTPGPTTTTTSVGSSPSTTSTTVTTTTSGWSPPSGVVWRGDVETGDVSQWRSVSISGRADVEVVSSPTHSGNYALQLINWDVDGSHNPGVRMNLQGPFGPDPHNLPDDGYYSAWYFIPFAFEGKSNVFQFKQSDATQWDAEGNPTSHTRRMLWKTSLYWTESGTYDMSISTRIDQATGEWQSSVIRLGTVDANIPVGQWFHLEARYRFGQNGSGHTTVWLNGTQVWDQSGSTEASNLECMHRCREWVVGHYLSDYQGYVAPGDSWIFLDDAILNTTRTGPDDE